MTEFPALASAALWSAATIGLYHVGKRMHRCRPRWWLSPLLTAPVLLIGLTLVCHTSYQDYRAGTGWLVWLLGPTTVAFALPIHQHRALLRQHGVALAAAVVAGSGTSMVTAWGAASLLQLDPSLRLSLLPRSISTPFAMTMAGELGGIPDLTAVFVVITGVAGAALGEVLLALLPVRSALARGALLGMGAHGAGVAKARELGPTEGSVAGLVMVLVGLLNILIAPVLVHWLKG